jgi:hypothetical protein
MNANSSAKPTNTGVAASHQRFGREAASPIVITSHRQMKRNSAPSTTQDETNQSR